MGREFGGVAALTPNDADRTHSLAHSLRGPSPEPVPMARLYYYLLTIEWRVDFEDRCESMTLGLCNDGKADGKILS